MSAVSTSDVWAVGNYANLGGSRQTLVEHWNGTKWSVVSSPNPNTNNTQLASVTAISSNNVWAVGYYTGSTGEQTLIEHWNGSTWNIVNSPDHAGSVGNQLMGVAAISASEIWAVGFWDTGHQSFQVLIEHWNGTKWSVTPSPNPGPTPNMLSAVTRVPANNSVWAVGNHFNSSNISVPLIEFHC